MNVNITTIPKIYINLDHRKDRAEHLQKELSIITSLSNCVRMSAIKHEYGALGCCLSHLAILRYFDVCSKSKDDNDIVGIILEDDLEFLVNSSYISTCIEEFASDKDLSLFCIAFNAQYPETIIDHSQNLLTTTDTQTTGGYIVKKDT